MRRTTAALCGLIIITTVLGGCAKSSIGLFESIELERKIIDDRALDNELPVAAMARAGGHYFIAAATLWQRLTVDTDYTAGDVAQWAIVAAPGPSGSGYTTSSLTVSSASGSDAVYVTFSSQDGVSAGLYAVDPAGDLTAVSADSLVLGTDDAGVLGLGKVAAINDGIADYLLAGVRTGTTRYAVYGSTTGTSGSFAAIAGTDNNLPVIDVTASSTGEVAFLTKKALLIDRDGLNTGADTADVTAAIPLADRQPEFGGLYYETVSGTLFVTDDEGYIYRSTDFGTTWLVNDTPHQVSTNDDRALSFTDMTAVDDGGTQLLVVGTDGHGYRELDSAFTPSAPAAELSNYQASELATASIIGFFVDPAVSAYSPTQTGDNYEQKTGDMLFAGTSNLGLWKTLYSGSAPQWVRE